MALTPIDMPVLEVEDGSGRRLLRDGMTVSFFMRRSHADVAADVAAAVQRYLRLPGLPPSVFLLDAEGSPFAVPTEDAIGAAASRLHEAPSECPLWISDDAEGAPRFAVRYQGLDLPTQVARGWPGAASGLSFWFPTDYLGEGGCLEIFAFAEALASALPFSTGLVAPAFLTADGALETLALSWARGLARRYRCFEVPALLPDAFEIGDGPKGAYWGNYLSSGLSARLGGEAGIRRAFGGTTVRLRTLASGAVSLYLEPLPRSGDVNRNEDTRVYALAFGLLRRTLAERRVPYPGFDEEQTAQWLQRHADDA